MAVSNLNVEARYVGDGSTTAFPISFAFIPGDLSPIKVKKFDATTKEEIPVSPGDYSLLPLGNNPTSVEFAVAPTTDESILIYRELPYTQVVDYIQNGPFLAETHETGLDRIVLMVQQLQEKLGRALSLNIADEAIPMQLPPLEANQVPIVNEDADGFDFIDRDDLVGEVGPEGPVGPVPLIAVNPVTTDVDYEGTGGVTVDVTDPLNPVLSFQLRAGPQGDSTVLFTISDQAPDDSVGGDGDAWLFLSNGDADNGDFYQRESGAYVLRGNIRGPAGGVNSFNGRTGNVTPAAGDYNAGQIDYDNATSGLTATDTNAAIDEVKTMVDNLEPLPAGGTAGQVLTKQSATPGDATWEDPGETLPPGGTTGQVLTKQSATDGDAVWVDPVATAEDVSYNNTTSGLAATDVQAAIDETADAVGDALTALAALLVTYAQALNGSANLLLANITGLVETFVIVTTSSTEFNSLNLPVPDRLTKLTIIMDAVNTTTTAITGAVDARATGIRLESGDSMTFVADLSAGTWKLIGRNY